MKSLVLAFAILLAVPASFAASQDNTELVMEVVAKSGLEDKMAKSQPNDLVSLRKYLYRAVQTDTDAKLFIVEANEVLLPEIQKIENEAQRIHEQTVVQYNLLLIASERGYSERNN